jgi:hypothetical protein
MRWVVGLVACPVWEKAWIAMGEIGCIHTPV